MNGDLEFEKLVELYYTSLYRFAHSLTRSESEACDLTQQTFLTWASKGSQLRDNKKVKSWLFTTLHREFLGKQRRIVRFPEVDLDSVELELPEIFSPTGEGIDRHSVLNALQKLDPTFRAAVALFYLEDYTHPEISGILNVPLGTVKSRISRGLAQLQQTFLESQPAGKEAR